MGEFVAQVVADRVENELRRLGSPERAAGAKAYLKSSLSFVGASVPEVRRAVSDVCRHCPDLDRSAVTAAAGALWSSEVFECRLAAVELLDRYGPVLGADDAVLVEQLLRQSRTWALVDPLATRIMGQLVERHPELGALLDEWVSDPDLWIRRAALLTLLVPLRRGAGEFERFGRYADALLGDREFFVQKAIGWVLRDTARRRPELVRPWVLAREARLSRVAWREVSKALDDGSGRPVAS